MRITVVIPAYNIEGMLLDAVDSCLHQTRLPDEILIVDDASSDRTLEVAREAAGMSSIVRVLEMGRNQGIAAVRNAGALAAKGELLAFSDGDDRLELDALRQVEAAMEREGSDCCACSVRWEISSNLSSEFTLNAPDKVIVHEQSQPPPDWLDRIMYDAEVIRRVSFIRKNALIDVGMYDSQMEPREDCEMYIRLARTGKKFSILRNPLYIYRRREGTLSTAPGKAGYRRRARGQAHLLEAHLRKAFLGGNRSLRQPYSEACWDQARLWLKGGSVVECLRWATRSCLHAPLGLVLQRVTHAVQFRARNRGSRKGARAASAEDTKQPFQSTIQ